MTKKIVHLTESEMKNLIENSVTNVLNEIGYRTASLAHGANYNAHADRRLTGNIKARKKERNSDAIRLPSLTKSIFDTVSSNINLMFFEFNPKDRQDYPVDFLMKDVYKCEQDRIVLKGVLTISANKPRTGYLIYNFANATFERGHITSSYNVVADMPLEIDNTDTNNIELIKRLLTHITNFLYFEADYESNVQKYGPTHSK